MLKINFLYILTVVGLIVLPFTSLRFGVVGLGEILILLVFFISVISYRSQYPFTHSMRSVLIFWGVFLVCSVLSAFANKILSTLSSGTLLSFIYDLSAYIFVIMLVLNLSLFTSSRFYVLRGYDFVNLIIVCWSVVFTGLYVTSFYTDTLFGLPLRYYGHFTPLVENVHQASSITCVMPFLNLYFALSTTSRRVQLLHFLFALSFVFMALDSNSTKALMGLIFGVVGLVMGYFLTNQNDKNNFSVIKLFLLILIFTFVGAYVVLNWQSMSNVAVEFFTENDASSARESLYIIGFEKALKSPIMGYGPGAHVPLFGHYMDAHNTLLTVILQAGFIGFIVFTIFIADLFRRVKSSPLLLAATCSLFMYILGGDVLRRLPIWFLICSLYLLTNSVDKISSQRSVNEKIV